MISPKTALRLIAQHAPALATVKVPIADSLGHVLAEDVMTRHPLPPFDNSAMDGYAIHRQDAGNRSRHTVCLPVTGTIFAGDARAHTLRSGHAMQIMTGAPVPNGAAAVIPKEKVRREQGNIVFDGPVRQGNNIRRRGEEVSAGRQVLSKGAMIHPGSLACLATVGQSRVRVYRRPTVAVIATGDETILPGQRLSRGQIYDSNSYMLTAMLSDAGCEPTRVRRVKDHAAGLTSAIKAALKRCDVLVVSGGVSVGERDYLRQVLNELGVREVFWRVSQKPGKPLFFGVRGKKLVFGLPGNPASAFTCFYVYVYEALRKLAGHAQPGLLMKTAISEINIKRDAKRWLFLKGKANKSGSGVTRLGSQASHMISSLVETDRLIVVSPGTDDVRVGDEVTTLCLPYGGEI